MKIWNGALGVCLAIGFTTAAIGMAPAHAADMPPLPAAIKEQGVLRVGVRCDYPPDGYYDGSGKPVGVEVEFAKQIAKYAFGDDGKTELVCVTAANRVPTLIGNKVDLLIATLGISDERKQVIDFSEPYTWSASSVIVPKDSAVQKMSDLSGQTVIVLKGAWQIPWFEKNMPDTKLMKLDTVSDALQAMVQGRGAGYAHDYAAQVAIGDKNDRVRMLDDRYQLGYRGIGLRKGEEELKTYLNAAIERARQDGVVAGWIKAYSEPELAEVRSDLWDLSKAPTQGQ